MMFYTITISLVVGIIGVILITRLLGRKELSQVTPLDFIYALILVGIIEESIYEDQAKFYHILFALALWAGLIWLVETLIVKFDQLRPIVKGHPIALIEDGKLNIKHVEKTKLETEQIRTLLRMQGIFSIEQVKHAVLETSGLISVIKKAKYDPVTQGDILDEFNENDPTYLLIEEGDISKTDLKAIGKSNEWLLNELSKMKLELNDIYFAEWCQNTGFHIQTYHQTTIKN